MNKNVRAYNVKIIETSTYKEIYQYERPIFSNSSNEKNSSHHEWINEDTKRNKFDELNIIAQYDSLQRKQKHYEAMRWEIARIVDCNYDNSTKFITLTFRENVTEIEFANNEFKKFIQRLNRRLEKKHSKAKYLATWEKQKRGSIHYHVIFFSLGYIKKSDLEVIWGNGFVQINKVNVDSIENRGRYLSKYFSKDLDIKEHKKKAFFMSQNLKRPIVKKLTSTNQIDFSNYNIVYQKVYKQKVLDTVNSEINFPKFKEGIVQYTKILKE